MPLSSVTINRQNGGLNQAPAGQDHISGLLIMEESLNLLDGAAGLITQETVQGLPLNNLEEAEALGITAAASATVHRHLRDFWALAPGATLFVAECNATNAKDVETASWAADILGEAVADLIDLAEGSLRQLAVIYDTDTAMTALIEEEVVPAMDLVMTNAATANKPAIAVIPSIYGAGTAHASADDLTGGTAERVVVVSGSVTETAPADSGEINFGSPVGAVLGLIAASFVHESIAWVGKYDGLKGLGYITPTRSAAQAETLVDKGYIELVKYVGNNGVFIAKSVTATSSTSDFNRIEKVRTMDKAVRGVRAVLLPQLNSPLYVTSEGTLERSTVAYFTNLAENVLEAMEVNGEISSFGVSIDPAQNVLSTSTLNISIQIVPVGSSETITVSIGYAVNIQTS